MIYRKWSLLTGPGAILGGIVVTVVVTDYLFVKTDPLLKTQPTKEDTASSTQ